VVGGTGRHLVGRDGYSQQRQQPETQTLNQESHGLDPFQTLNSAQMGSVIISLPGQGKIGE